MTEKEKAIDWLNHTEWYATRQQLAVQAFIEGRRQGIAEARIERQRAMHRPMPKVGERV